MIRMCTNNTTTTVDIVQGVMYIPVFLFGFFIHVAALRAFIVKRNSWTDTHIYMLNLAIADTTLVLFLPVRIYDAFICLPITYFCTVLISIHYINMYASILTTAAISVHRYLAVRFPMQTRSWRKKKAIAVGVCFIIWGLLIGTCAAFSGENSPEKLWTCYERRKNKPLNKTFMIFMVVVGFLIPLIIVLFCSSQILSDLSKVDNTSANKKAVTGIVRANMIVFIVCYTPIHIGFLVNYFIKPPPNWQNTVMPAHIYLIVSEWIASTNCCFDSISYYFLLKSSFS
ncbi:G-protein coupled receptor 55 [Sphaeramia orbicularis]|uniref:G-protein coupled receptor 55-like n=1 Tax=Sphaeramia orbicularis TaxID=375764 RepID=A0A673AJ69_9TELE|nr:G-protein coupled receptor 55-like [Sphaeramia orbicularis]